MNKLVRTLSAVGIAVTLVGTVNTFAQPQGQPPGGPGGPGGPGFRFDPAQMRQAMLDRAKEQLAVTSEDEWKVVSERIQKVMDARRDVGSGGFGGFGRGGMRGQRQGGGGGGQGGGGQGGGAAAGGGGGGGGGATAAAGGGNRGPQADPEAEDLQKAIDSKASAEELKTKLGKLRDARKAKEAKLEAAQEDLRKVLSVRQEAVAVLNGWLR